MSQSKPSYGDGTPKDSGKTQYQSQTPPESAPAPASPPKEGPEVETEPVPACRCKHVDEWEWVEIPYTAALTASYDACEWDECFTDGPPDVDSVETVIRSRRFPSVYHRVEHQPADGHDNDDHECAVPTWNHPFESVDLAESEPVDSIAEVCVGDGVAWDCLETPLLVTEQHETSGVVLRGPSGGEYQLRARYDDSLVVSPGRGYIEGLVRIVTDDQPRPETETV